MNCLVCLLTFDPTRYPAGTLMCGSCFARLRRHISILVGAHTWLGIAMLNPTPAWKPGTIHRAGGSRLPFRAELHDAREDIAGKLASWTQLIAEEHEPALAGPASTDVATVARWLVERLPWVSGQPWCDAMANELAEAARSSYALVPWDRQRRDLPLPCPACGVLLLSLYSGDELIGCRNPECGCVMSRAQYAVLVQEQHDKLVARPIPPSLEIIESGTKPPTSSEGVAA